jgi:hypothetical protein
VLCGLSLRALRFKILGDLSHIKRFTAKAAKNTAKVAKKGRKGSKESQHG